MVIVASRVHSASLDADGEHICEIKKGLLLYVGISAEDTEETVSKAAQKVVNLRIFPNEEGKMYYSVKDICGEILAVSNFTLCANVKSRRPDFTKAAKPDRANELFEFFKSETAKDVTTKSGVFGAHMDVDASHDGPVNIVINL